MPTVREYEAALERNPSDTEAFVALRKAYRQAQQHDRLIILYETRAQALEDGPKAAELFYLAAEQRLDQLGDVDGAEADLAHAVHRDPGHIRAAARLKDLYREQGRTPEYMQMLETEAAAVARTRDPARIAELQSEMGQLFVNHFGRLEQIVRNAQRPGKLSPENLKSVESARKIYRALGDYRNVVRLYELELEGTTDPKRRADLLLGLGRVLAERLEELDAAAQRLAEVIRLRPRDEKALELLASVYANPNWIGVDGPERAAAIYHQLGRRRQEAGDIENAIAALRKALVALPGHSESSDLIERIYYDANRLQDLDHYYRERVQNAGSNDEQIDFLYKRAQLAEGDLGDKAEAQRIYAEITELEPPAGPASDKLAELFSAGREYGKLAELREKQLGAIEDPGERVRLMTELATLYRERLTDRDQAAVYLHAILQLDPGNRPALAAYAEHFREKEDWPALADLLEFAFEQVRDETPVEELTHRLEEIAAVSEKHLGDPERALAAWRRLEEIDASYARAREAQKRILLKAKSFDRIVPILEREAGLTEDPAQKIEILRRIAQIHREKLAAPEKAAELYKQILVLSPRDQAALRALVEIHERQGDFAGLAAILRDQLESAASKQERVSLLRRVLVIYDEKLNDVAQGSWAAGEILQAVPGDRDTLARFEDLLERAGEYTELVKTLEYHGQHATTAEERVQLLSRLALLQETKLDDPAGATETWEKVVRIDPDDARALEALTEIYEKLGRHADHARVLDAQVDRLIGDPQQQAMHLRRLAALAEGPLGDQRRAQRAWEHILELLPSDSAALDALCRIYGDTGDWSTLVRVLEKKIAQTAEPADAVVLALRRAEILENKLENPVDAARALEQAIAELDPRSWEAHRRLRAIYERAEDWANVVKVAERQLLLTEASEDKAARALELGTLWRDRLNDSRRAIAAFERARELAPGQRPALVALAPLYESAKSWERLVDVNGRLLAETEDPTERRRLMVQIAAITEEHLGDARGAFEWYRRAFLEFLDSESLALVEAVAERHALYKELVDVYDANRSRATDRAEQLEAVLRIAALREEKLGQPELAFGVLRDGLAIDPAGTELLQRLEQLAEKTGDWKGLLDAYARVVRNRSDLAERVELLRRRAEVREKRLADPSGALDELIRSFALDPENAGTQDEILRLAALTGRWEDAIKVQAQLFALAQDLPRKLAVARKAAALVETEVKDLVRAFRAYLNAFRLSPDDGEIVANLWRLAGTIGRYERPAPITERVQQALDALDEAPITSARDEGRGAPAHLEAGSIPLAPGAGPGLAEDGEPILGGDGDGGEDVGDMDGAFTGARSDADDAAAGFDARAGAAYGDEGDDAYDGAGEPGSSADTADDSEHGSFDPSEESTAGGEDDDAGRSVFAGDTEEQAASHEGDEVEVDDAAVIAVALDPDSSGALEELDVSDLEVADDSNDGAPAPTPPPLPLPIARAFGMPGPMAVAQETRDARALVAPFETPWEELAQAYESLPAADAGTRRSYLLKVAEVWERGQKDVTKALGALARAFRLDPRDTSVRTELERIAKEHDRWDEVCTIYLGGIDEFAPIEQTVSVHHEVARFREALGQVDQAEERYRAILDIRPDDAHALQRLEEITREQERWADLANVLERRTSGPLEALPAGPSRRVKLRELAGLYEERLEKPYEAIDTLERLVAEATNADDSGGSEPAGREELAEACEALARLYGRVGLWTKMVETLSRESELTDDATTLRALRLRIARVYEQELGHPDRAIEAYEAVLLAVPGDAEVLEALDRLYESHARWDSLQETLARRAAHASDATERLALVRRRVRILEERLGNPELAAAALRELGADVLADADLSAALVRSLRRAGLAHEAARPLVQRIELLRATDPRSAELVPLLLELAAVRADDLSDTDGARAAISAALEIAPQSPEVLAALGRLDLKANDFVAYAGTRRREGHAYTDMAAAAASLLDAGRVYRDQAADPEKARACFEEALQRDPGCVEALRALAALHASQGDWTAAREALGRQLALADDPTSRAAALTDMARALSEGGGDSAEAHRHLDEALSIAPDYLPAVMTAADFFYREGQWALAEKRLADAIRRSRSNHEQTTALYLRLAEVSERLGKLEEAYRELVEADRLAPGRLAIKLALGENRFRAGKWREATMYLAPLADHPEAALHADEVADALAHAAQAEVKLRRPERALSHYEAALKLRAGHTPSLEALSQIALEAGDKAQARTLLERLAENTPDRERRVVLLEQIGDLYLEAGDTAQARAWYEAGAVLFDRPQESQVSVLEKALRLQREAGDGEAAAQTANLLIELVQDPRERARRRREAAALVAGHGQGAKALALIEAALADNPHDDEVLATLCDLLARQNKRAQITKRLAEVLPTLPAPEDTLAARQRRAALWERLAEGRRRKDPTGAIAALERALEIQPDRVSARLALAGLYRRRVEFADAALGNLRQLVDCEPNRTDSVRALADTFAERGLLDAARCAYELVELLAGDDADPVARDFLKAHPLPELKAEDPYVAALDDADRRALAGPDATVMAEVFTLLWEGAPQLLNERLEDLGVTAEHKISPMSDLDFARVFGQVAKALGVKKTALYVQSDLELEAPQIVVQTPPALVFGSELGRATLAESRFQLARGLELTRSEYILAAGVPPKKFTQLFGSVLRAFHPRHARRRAGGQDAALEQAAVLRKNVPYKVSKRLAEIFQEMGAVSWSSVGWRNAVADAGNRTGLLLAADLAAAARIILRAGKLEAPSGTAAFREAVVRYAPLRELVRFSLSDEHFRLREKLGTAVLRAAAA